MGSSPHPGPLSSLNEPSVAYRDRLKGLRNGYPLQKGSQDAVVAVEANESTSFEFQVSLDEGINRFAIQATNANGRQFSTAVRLTTTLDTIPPRAPTCPDCPVSVEAESTAELVGKRTPKPIFSATRTKSSPIPTRPNGATASRSQPVSIPLHSARWTKQATSVKNWF